MLLDETKKNALLGGGSILALSNNPGIEGLIDIGDLGLSAIEDGESLAIGANCTIRRIQKAPEIQRHFSNIIGMSAGNYLTALLRNQAQLGGVLAASFNADIVGALLSLGAFVHFYGAEGEKIVPMDEIYAGHPIRYFERNVATKVTVPKLGQIASCRRIARTATDVPVISVFVSRARSGWRVVVNAASHLPARLKETERLLCETGRFDFAKIGESAGRELKAISDVRGSAGYRKEMAGVLLRRAVEDLVRGE